MPNYDAMRGMFGDSRAPNILGGLYDLFTSIIPSKNQSVGSRSQTKSADKKESDNLTIDFFEKIAPDAFYTAITVVAKNNNINLVVVGYKVKDSGRKLEIFVDVSGDLNHKDLTKEIYQEYDSETRKSSNDDCITYISIEKFIIQINQNNLSGSHAQINGGILISGESNNMTGDIYNVGQSGSTGKHSSSYNNTFIQSGQKQTLAEVASEIQRLLKQLEQTNPNVTEAEKVAYVNDETTPSLKRRAVGALQAAGEAAIEGFLDNPYVNVGKAIVKGWMKPE